MDIQKEIEKIYYQAGGYNDLIEAIAIIEAKDYKALHDLDPEGMLDEDTCKEIAEDIKEDILQSLNATEGNI